MPSTSNDGAAFDPVDYYTRQLPLELARLTEVRDELRQRQGAMSAVEEAHSDRQAAAAELQAAKDQAAVLLADAKAADAKSKAKAAQLTEREKALAAAEAEAAAAVARRETAVATRERNAEAREVAVAASEERVIAAIAVLDAERTAFNVKVASFQSMAAQMKA